MANHADIAPELEQQHLFENLGNGNYSIETDKLEELRKKRYVVRNEYIDGLIKQGQAELDAANNTKDVCERVLNIKKQFGNEAEQLAAQIEFAAANALVKQIKDTISTFEAMKGNITYPDDKNDISDTIQNQIDYYNTIIFAIEIIRDKYSEAFEKEKDALEGEKNALEEGKKDLKEANDERDRELKLIEARNNLENAKKRITIL